MTTEREARAKIVLENILERRSLPPQMMKPDPIDMGTLSLLLEAANWAPTHKLTEPWRFRIYSEAGRQRLAQALGTAYRETIGDRFDQRKFDKTTNRPLGVPLVMAIIMSPGLKANLPEFEEVAAVGCAVQNMHLAAHAMNIGCFWSTPKYLENDGLRSFLALEPHERCLGFFYLGYPKDSWPNSKRRPIQNKIAWVKN